MNWWQAFGNPNDYLEVRWAALFFVAALLWAGGAGLRRPLSYMGWVFVTTTTVLGLAAQLPVLYSPLYVLLVALVVASQLVGLAIWRFESSGDTSDADPSL